ncbi:MAG TPA: hypothetical protein ENH41_01715 [Candidatus Omnitrophica bacterium]|nr:hypothetical protein [Candidatus Omnitrophota bacterium]
MRKETFTVGDYIHVYNRGNRKQPIVRQASDRWHFLQALYYFNNEISIANPFNGLRNKLDARFNHELIWPREWPLKKPLVKIIAFSLMENHFHLILNEIREDGIALFMQKLGTGIVKYFNAKYREAGRLFQGSYKARVVDRDEYLTYLSVYIQVKNPFELYPKGIEYAVRNFDQAFEWAVKYPYCSLADYVGRRNSPIISRDILAEMFEAPEKYKEFARDCILSMNFKERLESLVIDE